MSHHLIVRYIHIYVASYTCFNLALYFNLYVQILDAKVADFDESITDTPSRIEGDDKSDCSSIREFDAKMLEEIMYKGDPVFTEISLTSIADREYW